MSDGTQTACTLVPIPHTNAGGFDLENGHFEIYLKNSTGDSTINKKTNLPREVEHQRTAQQAYVSSRRQAAIQWKAARGRNGRCVE